VNILGPDALVFAVDEMAACATYLTDYGLHPVGNGRFEALDGTAVLLRPPIAPDWPVQMGPKNKLVKTVYGVADNESLIALSTELKKDREVREHPDGSIESVDDMGFVIGFQVTIRRKMSLPAEYINSPGATAQRAVNVLGVVENAPALPRTLSHVVYFVPNAAKAEAFYTTRLGFRCTDRLLGAGPFLRPGGSLEHHTLFLIETPPFMKGCEHFTFHVGGPTEMMQAGTRFVSKGHESFWGPGRHYMGSNWFWYFNSPLGCHVEYDADMDLHDDSWKPRSAPAGADTTQLFLFQHREKWFPAGPPPKSAVG
jgi:catechol 2,3-dioxygenase-like lactoylglutathione lyase family enzyme